MAQAKVFKKAYKEWKRKLPIEKPSQTLKPYSFKYVQSRKKKTSIM